MWHIVLRWEMLWRAQGHCGERQCYLTHTRGPRFTCSCCFPSPPSLSWLSMLRPVLFSLHCTWDSLHTTWLFPCWALPFIIHSLQLGSISHTVFGEDTILITLCYSTGRLMRAWLMNGWEHITERVNRANNWTHPHIQQTFINTEMSKAWPPIFRTLGAEGQTITKLQ